MRGPDDVLTPAPPRADRDGRDGGFTLVELVIAVAILGIVMVALTNVFFTALVSNRDAEQRIDGSRAEQFAAVRFADDAQTARPGGIVTTGTAQCGTRALFVEFRGDTYDPAAGNPAASPRVTVVTYSVVRVTTGVVHRELHRLTCEAAAGTATPLTPTGDTVVARDLKDVTPDAPVVTDAAQVTVTFTHLDGTTFTLVGTRRTT